LLAVTKYYLQKSIATHGEQHASETTFQKERTQRKKEEAEPAADAVQPTVLSIFRLSNAKEGEKTFIHQSKFPPRIVFSVLEIYSD